MENKPREWKIKEAFVGAESGTRYPAHITSVDDNYEGGMIHVIEYSAYEELKKFKDAWVEKDGNSPGYNLQKAKTYGDQNQKLLDIIKRQQDALEFYTGEGYDMGCGCCAGDTTVIQDEGKLAAATLSETKEELEKLK